MHLRTTFLWTVIISLSIAAAMGVLALLVRDFGETQAKVLGTSLLTGAFGVTALCCAVALGKRIHVGAMWTGIAASGLSLLIWVSLIWFEWYWYSDAGEVVGKCGTTTTIVALWAAHLGILSMLPLQRPAGKIVRRITFVLAGALGILVAFVFWTEEFEDWSGRAIGILAILGSCGTIVAPILGLIDFVQYRGTPESIDSRLLISLTCPRCGEAQALRAGTAKCDACGLKIMIDVAEPRCHCGYLLYRLTGDTCPECGRAIEERDRWHGSPAETANAPDVPEPAEAEADDTSRELPSSD